jgi:hypothetical protein
MHEIAAATSLAGHDVELRGLFLPRLVEDLTRLTGARIATPLTPREATPEDLVITTEGHPNPRDWATAMLSPARTIITVLAPPGLFGWPFVDGWTLRDPLDVDPADVGHAEHLTAMEAAGFELWTNNAEIARLAAGAGVECTDIGRGSPGGTPATPPKTSDVAVVTANRWSALAQRAIAGLEISVDRIPPTPHAELLARVGAARILVHLPRIEGHSRIATEARAMGTVPVGLESNRFAAGMREAEGGLCVKRVEDVAPAVLELLADPVRLSHMAEAGKRTAAAELDWDGFAERVATALAAPARPNAARAAVAAMGRAVTADRQALLSEVLQWRDAEMRSRPEGAGRTSR